MQRWRVGVPRRSSRCRQRGSCRTRVPLPPPGLGSSGTFHPSSAQHRARGGRKPYGHPGQAGDRGLSPSRGDPAALRWCFDALCLGAAAPRENFGASGVYWRICICQRFHDNVSHLLSPRARTRTCAGALPLQAHAQARTRAHTRARPASTRVLTCTRVCSRARVPACM